MDYRISVIIPVYNVEKYLNRCVESVIDQTYANLEIILVDDGSTDESTKICDDWKAKDSRISVIHKANGGLASARNAGLEMATGDFVSFIDSDDYIDKALYTDMVKYFDDDSLNIVAFGLYEVYGDNKTSVNIKDGYIDVKEAIKHLLTWDGQVRSFAWNKIYRMSVVRKMRFYEDLRYGEDTPFVFGTLINSEKYLQINRPYYYYVRRNDSLIGDTYKTRWLLSIEASRKILLFCIENKSPYFDLARCSVGINCYILKKFFCDSREIKKEFKEDYTYICDQMNGIPSYLMLKYSGFSKWMKYVAVKRFPLACSMLSWTIRKTK